MLQKQEAQLKFENQIQLVKTEITEENYKNIAWELHDNIGQLLAVASMQLKSAVRKYNSEPIITEASSIVSDAIQEVRSLSHGLNNSFILDKGLLNAIEIELERLKRFNSFEIEIEMIGTAMPINQDHELFIFRILQEFLSNSIKYAQANKICFSSNYSKDKLVLELSDNGIGFTKDQVKKGSGMGNMEERAEMIGAELSIDSEPDKGTRLQLIYPITQKG